MIKYTVILAITSLAHLGDADRTPIVDPCHIINSKECIELNKEIEEWERKFHDKFYKDYQEIRQFVSGVTDENFKDEIEKDNDLKTIVIKSFTKNGLVDVAHALSRVWRELYQNSISQERQVYLFTLADLLTDSLEITGKDADKVPADSHLRTRSDITAADQWAWYFNKEKKGDDKLNELAKQMSDRLKRISKMVDEGFDKVKDS